jgi:hypothetical protein
LDLGSQGLFSCEDEFNFSYGSYGDESCVPEFDPCVLESGAEEGWFQIADFADEGAGYGGFHG